VDGRLAYCSWDKTIRLWDAAAGAEAARFEGHFSEINALCLLKDGRLASGSDDNTIRLWDVAAGAEIARLEVDAPVTADRVPWRGVADAD
jgi:WD40 repeat protein